MATDSKQTSSSINSGVFGALNSSTGQIVEGLKGAAQSGKDFIGDVVKAADDKTTAISNALKNNLQSLVAKEEKDLAADKYKTGQDRLDAKLALEAKNRIEDEAQENRKLNSDLLTATKGRELSSQQIALAKSNLEVSNLNADILKKEAKDTETANNLLTKYQQGQSTVLKDVQAEMDRYTTIPGMSFLGKELVFNNKAAYNYYFKKAEAGEIKSHEINTLLMQTQEIAETAKTYYKDNPITFNSERETKDRFKNQLIKNGITDPTLLDKYISKVFIDPVSYMDTATEDTKSQLDFQVNSAKTAAAGKLADLDAKEKFLAAPINDYAAVEDSVKTVYPQDALRIGFGVDKRPANERNVADAENHLRNQIALAKSYTAKQGEVVDPLFTYLKDKTPTSVDKVILKRFAELSMLSNINLIPGTDFWASETDLDAGLRSAIDEFNTIKKNRELLLNLTEENKEKRTGINTSANENISNAKKLFNSRLKSVQSFMAGQN